METSALDNKEDKIGQAFFHLLTDIITKHKIVVPRKIEDEVKIPKTVRINEK